jgi:streptogramin lyase
VNLLYPTRPHSAAPDVPRLDRLFPRAAIPGGSFEITGAHLLGVDASPDLPLAFLGTVAATLDLARPTRALVRVPGGAISSDLSLRRDGLISNALQANIAVPMVEDLHMISNPAIDADGNLFAMVSGPRGEQVPVSIFRVARDLQVTPFVRDLMNVSALAFDRNGYLYASSRSEGTIYRISPEGAISTFAEGMGIATGIAFGPDGSLFVGDRSGTIFKLSAGGKLNAGSKLSTSGGAGTSGKVAPGGATNAPHTNPEIFVFATLEPSVAFYHLCYRADGVLLVTAPTTSSNQPIYAIDPDGATTVFYRGLGRPQGMAFDVDNNLYVAASLHGHRGIVRIWKSLTTSTMQAELLVAGNDLVGLCFLDDGCCALATNSTIFHADLGIEGHPLV